MTGQDDMQRIREIAEKICNREGCYLYDLEMVGSGGTRALRVYVDREEPKGGASIEDCTNISRGFNEVLDADEDLVPGGEYELEVSTPGLERVLKEPRHYDKAIGRSIDVRTSSPLTDFNPEIPELGKAKQIVGPLLGYDETGLTVGFELPPGSRPKISKRQLALREAALAESLAKGLAKGLAEGLAEGSGQPLEDENNKRVFIPFSALTKANIVFDFDQAIRGAKSAAKDQKKSERAAKEAKKK